MFYGNNNLNQIFYLKNIPTITIKYVFLYSLINFEKTLRLFLKVVVNSIIF